MKVLLDECVHQQYRHDLASHSVFTARYLGWDGIRNGRLLALAAAAGFDSMVTTDKNIEFQQNAQQLPLTIYLLHPETDDLADLQKLTPNLLLALVAQSTPPRFIRILP